MNAFNVARKAANKVNPIVTDYRHTSVIVSRKGQAISIGRNHFAGKIIEISPDTFLCKTVHSEMDALRKVKIRKLQGATLINYARTNVATNLARPCPECYPLILRLGFSTVFYSVRSSLLAPKWVKVKL